MLLAQCAEYIGSTAKVEAAIEVMGAVCAVLQLPGPGIVVGDERS